MKKLILTICLFTAFLVLPGCQLKYIELTKETFSQLDSSKVKEVDAVYENRFHSGDKWIKIGEIFPIREPNKISSIVNCIQKADFNPKYNGKKILFVEVVEVALDKRKEPDDPVMRKEIFREIYYFEDPNIINIINNYIRKENSTPMVMIDEKIPFYRLLFKTDEAIYFIRFLWDKESVYGDWWDSPELLKNFKK